MSRARRWFYAAVAAQGLFLAVWAGWNEWLLRRSPTVLLDTRPVDPMELLRGDYMTMNYVIASAPRDLVGDEGAGGIPGYGEPVCVTLAPAGEFHAIAAVRRGECRCPSAGGGDAGFELNGTITHAMGAGDTLRIDYGIGRYYVPEGKGTPRGKVTARVSITPWCRALIREVYLDGTPYP